ncbi:MAG TPA: hypothetical protein VFZ53_03215 [Polyangiaceae bacterium]
MTRKSIGKLTGLGLFAVVACGGGGYAHDYTEPDPDAPWDPAAPPADTTTPPFGDVAPPPPGSTGAGGTSSTGGSGGGGGDAGGGGKGGMPMNCTELCDEAERECQGTGVGDPTECDMACQSIPGGCFPETRDYFRCIVANGCADTAGCEEEVLALSECIGPEV